jgi:uncharacterized membrane protein
MASFASHAPSSATGVSAATEVVTTALTRQAERTGLLVTAAVAPSTFTRSLGPRSAVDQGIISGMVMGLTYATTVATQDALTAIASVGAHGGPDQVRRRLALVDLAAIPVGLAVSRALTVRDDESPLRSLVRQAAWRSGATGLGSLVFLSTDWAARRLDARLGSQARLQRLPLALPGGLLLAAGLEWQRRRNLPPEAASDPEEVRAALPASLGIGLGVSAGLATLAFAEERLASAVEDVMARAGVGGQGAWRLAGHAAVLSGLGAVGWTLWNRAMVRVESAALAVDAVFADEADHRRTLDSASGSRESLIPWETLGREGRRHVITVARPEPLADRPAGFPDLSIPTVTGQPAIASPVHVYVGLDAAPTAAERVTLALAEMDRTRAWERRLIMLVSPTGTGYVNYCAVAAAEYLTRGDIAVVTMQYSKRPSPLSLGKVATAREQNRLLWSRIAARVRDLPPEQRPRVVLFGESLGAHTSQDVFLHWGTTGLEALGIERALWVGTPYSSGWMQEVTRPGRDDTDADLVAVVNDIEQLRSLPQERRDRVRYVLLSHDNDGVTKFGTDLIMRSPRWLRETPSGVHDAGPYSPRGVPASMRWRPVTTFFQVMVDMKNAQTPGAYLASRHDYRPDLTRFVNEVYGLGADEEQVRIVEDAVARREQAREEALGDAPGQPAQERTPNSAAAGQRPEGAGAD